MARHSFVFTPRPDLATLNPFRTSLGILTAVPGQSVSQPEHLLTPRIGAIPHQNPLGLALDQKVLLGRPVPRDMGDVAVAGGEEDQDVNCASSEARSDNAEPPDDDEVGVTDFSDASRSPSPALTVSNG